LLVTVSSSRLCCRKHLLSLSKRIDRDALQRELDKKRGGDAIAPVASGDVTTGGGGAASGSGSSSTGATA
jgi:hypothetical protein